MTTGQRMRNRRKELGISAESIAEKLNVSPATIYRYENGDIEKMPGNILEPIANILQTTPWSLMGWDNTSESQLILSPKEKQLVVDYRDASEEIRDAAALMLHTSAEAAREEGNASAASAG